MSGGFFRGTSAEQDTRFSNKQAKLMKSQKFAPELENLVDMTKVKMDVMRPWIANRVTEFIGFEDEVLINFIYGLLEGKVVNGKEIQISLTGFMERNTGKFMKELWMLLLSAQNNASGVPQQFLDAKEEESKKKKAESDRLMNEIQRRKDKEIHEREQERHKRTDAGNGVSKASVEPSLKDQQTDLVSKTEKQTQHEGRNGLRGRRSSKSPLSADRSSSPRGRHSKSVSRSISNSKSNSKSRSRSVSISPKWRRRPSPSENRFPQRVSQSPYRWRSPRRSLTPARRRSSYYRRRSISQSRHSSPSPPRYRMRSPVRRRSRSPLRRRSRSPMRRRSRSPMRPRSRSPPRHQSRSPSDGPLSPVRARSPFIRRRSPAAYRRSPVRYRSPSPQRRRHRGSPSTLRRRSPSPPRRSTSTPRHRRSPCPATRKSSLPRNWSSPSHSRSASPVRRSPPRKYRSPVGSSRERTRDPLKSYEVHGTSPPSRSERASGTLKRGTPSEQNDSRRKATALPLSPHKSLSISEVEREMSPVEAKRSRGLQESPTLTNKVRITQSHMHSPRQEPQNEKSTIGSLKKSSTVNDNSRKDGLSSHKSSTNPSQVHKSSHGMSSVGDESSKKISGHHSDQTLSRQKMESNNKDEAFKSGNEVLEKVDRLKKPSHPKQHMVKDASLTQGTRDSPILDGSGTYKKTTSLSDDMEIKDRPVEPLSKLSSEVEQNEKTVPLGSSSEESDQKRRKVNEKKKNKRPRELESEDESSIDSYEEERKDAKRRRKEEKKLRKEERRRKRHERRRKREERHAKKKTPKSADSVSSASDTDYHNDGHSDDDRHVRRHESRDVDMKETESDPKKLEMQLREKALESLRAKKGIGH